MMNVRDAMTPDPATCGPTTTLRLVAMLMLDQDCAAVPIVSGGEVAGIVTDRDIACRAVAQGLNAAELPASAVMTGPLVAVNSDETFDDAIQVMRENHVYHLPVIDDDGRLVGIVAQYDLGRRMTNVELGQLTRATSIRGARQWPSKLVGRKRVTEEVSHEIADSLLQPPEPLLRRITPRSAGPKNLRIRSKV